MNMPLSILPDEELRRSVPVDDEVGFGALTTARGGLPLRAMDVRAEIDGLLAQVNLAQTFVNSFDEPLEATYIFPLPDRAAVTRFRMEVGGRVVEGVLKERGSARREYAIALKAGQRAAIAEEERPGVFTLRVGNIMPGEAARVSLRLAGPLNYDCGEVTFRFPLVVAPRYIPGAALPGPSVGAGTVPDTDAVPDASRITPPVLLPGFASPVRLSLTALVQHTGIAVSDIRSSLHAILTEEVESGYRISLQPGERLDRDFILRYRVGGRAVTSGLTLLPDADSSREGTFALLLVPPMEQSTQSRPRDVVFVLDRSGSMGGWKMVAARRALGRMVDTLTHEDRFTVYAFDDRLELPAGFDGLVPATDRNRFRAIEFLAKLEARGGTEMAQPLTQAVRLLHGERERVLVLITDGQVGNEDEILRSLGKHLAGIRVYTLGVDQAVNEAFLKRLAALGGGCCDVVESEDRLDDVMEKLQRRLGTALLTDLRLEASGVQLVAGSVTPARVPDLFAGSAVMVLGRYRGAAEGKLALQAQDEAGRPWSQVIVGRRTENAALSQVWARARVRTLEDRWVIGAGDAMALEREILDLSLRFGVLSRFTAFVAVDRAQSVNEGGELHRVVQPVEAPAGWAMAIQAAMAPALSVARAKKRKTPTRKRTSPKPDKDEALDAEAAEMLSEDLADENESVDSMLLDFDLTLADEGGVMVETEFDANSLAYLATEEEDQVADTPLEPYRSRAQDLRDLLRVAGSDDLLVILGKLAVRLASFLEDLKSVGEPTEFLKPMEKLLADLKRFLASTRPSRNDAIRLGAECESVLRAFVESARVVSKRPK